MRFAVLNSRKPRRTTPLDRWVRLTALLVDRLARGGNTLVCGLGPLHYDLALRGAIDAGGTAEVVLDAGPGTLREEALRSRHREPFECPAVRLIAPATTRATGEERDRAVSCRADLAVVVEARAGGIVERLGLERLRTSQLLLVCPPDGTPGTRGNARLLAAGAGVLDPVLLGRTSSEFRAALAAPSAEPSPPPAEPSGPLGERPWPWVVHFTRTCPGEWPGESRWEFLGTLLGSRDPLFHGARRALERILAERRIRASSRLIRGGHGVVSLTAAHPAAVAAPARWARHLGRWTFEPWGVGLRQEAALARGLRPVVYGPPGLYRALSEDARWLYQAASSAGIDWSAECEWRAQGDIELSRWKCGDVIVVVPDIAEARAVRRISSFPVVALHGTERLSSRSRTPAAARVDG
jgi:hypothetical protein